MCSVKVLADIGVMRYLSITIGLGWSQIHSLDAQITVCVPGHTYDPDEAWYLLLLYPDLPTRVQYPMSQDQWYLCMYWQSMGQRPVFGGVTLSDVRAAMRLARYAGHMDAASEQSIDVYRRQLGMSSKGKGKSKL